MRGCRLGGGDSDVGEGSVVSGGDGSGTCIDGGSGVEGGNDESGTGGNGGCGFGSSFANAPRLSAVTNKVPKNC